MTTWMDLEVIMLSETGQRKTNTARCHFCNLKKTEKAKQNRNSFHFPYGGKKMFIKSATVIMVATVTLLTPIKIIFNYSPRELFLNGSTKPFPLSKICVLLYFGLE